MFIPCSLLTSILPEASFLNGARSTLYSGRAFSVRYSCLHYVLLLNRLTLCACCIEHRVLPLQNSMFLLYLLTKRVHINKKVHRDTQKVGTGVSRYVVSSQARAILASHHASLTYIVSRKVRFFAQSYFLVREKPVSTSGIIRMNKSPWAVFSTVVIMRI